MLNERAQNETTDKQGSHRDLQPSSVCLAGNDKQERIDGKQHGRKHQQDVGHQNVGRHIIAETHH